MSNRKKYELFLTLWHRFRNYEWSILIASLLGISLSLALLLSPEAAANGLTSTSGITTLDTFTDALFLLNMTAGLVSGASYIAEGLDYLFKFKTLFMPGRKYGQEDDRRFNEYFYPYLGSLLGIVFGTITALVFLSLVSNPYIGILPIGVFAIIFIVNTIGAHAGIGSRIGQACFQFKSAWKIPRQVVRNYDWAIFISAIAAVILASILSTLLGPIVGGIPTWFLLVSLSSSIISASSCIGRALDLFTRDRYGREITFIDLLDLGLENVHRFAANRNWTAPPKLIPPEEWISSSASQMHQRRWTYAGITIAVISSVILLATVGSSIIPLVATPFAFATGCAIYCMVSIASIGGLFNRIGRVLDSSNEIIQSRPKPKSFASSHFQIHNKLPPTTSVTPSTTPTQTSPATPALPKFSIRSLQYLRLNHSKTSAPVYTPMQKLGPR